MLDEKHDEAHLTKARKVWEQFQSDLRSARALVGVSQTRAWFRGIQGDHDLIPHLFRVRHCSRPSCRRTIFRAHRLDLTKAHRLVRLERWATGITNRNKALQAEIAEELAQHSRSTRFLSLLMTKKRKIRQLKRAADGFSKLLKDLCQSAQVVSVDVEREAFDEYRVLSGCKHDSTWETLAEMRHYGIPTRLLDWSPSFDTALYFALLDLQAVYHEYHCRSFTDFLNRFQTKLGLDCKRFDQFVKGIKQIWSNDHEPQACRVRQNPTIWVFNPITACKHERALRDQPDRPGRIYEFSHDNQLDYYDTFFTANTRWPFVLPVPMYSPWRSERLAAQQAAFTVHGRVPTPMNILFPTDILTKVVMEPLAALYGVQYLHDQGVDGFVVFRDLDSLGRRIKRAFFGGDVP